MSTKSRATVPTICKVCGSSAPVIRADANFGTVALCYYHEYVCRPHLLDPCPECDAS